MMDENHPTAFDVATLFLRYKLDVMLEKHPVESIKRFVEVADWPFEFLNYDDLEFLKSLGVRWSESHRGKSITGLISTELEEMRDQGLQPLFRSGASDRSTSIIIDAL
jgi:hypothetical protein